ncbi:MAG: FIST C-terminal domain-containing protein, partial [Phycisphaerae bacterium]
LLFSCNGRGTRMYDEPGHDLGIIRDVLGALPVAGLFCAGEIGTVSGQAFVHGHTASIGLFRPAPAAGHGGVA